MEFPFEYITPDIKLFRNHGKEFKMEVVFVRFPKNRAVIN